MVNFPTSLDALTNPVAGDLLSSVTVPHATQHANLNDAVEALEAKVGVDGSSDTSSLDYKVANKQDQTASQTDSSTGTINALTVTGSLMRLTGAAPDLRGMTPPYSGKSTEVKVYCVNATTLRNQAGTASAANRIQTVTGADLPVPAGSTLTFAYDTVSSYWRQMGPAVFTSATAGMVPLSGGGTTNFLRADGSWATPSGGGGAPKEIRIRIPGSIAADANIHQGLWWYNNTGASVTLSNVAFTIAVTPGTSCAFNVYKSSGTASNGIDTSAVNLFTSAVTISTGSYTSLTNVPNTTTVESGRFVSLRCTAVSGTAPSDVEAIISYA